MTSAMIYGWDLGGAHVKCVVLDAQGHVVRAEQVPCTLWLGVEHLRNALARLMHTEMAPAVHAVTMTGELVDLFPNRADGVAQLLKTFVHEIGERDTHVFDGTGFLNPTRAIETWQRIASANWRASAMLASTFMRDGLLLDVGSTTTDITAIENGQLVDGGNDDYARLMRETLIYSGVVRTPLMALASRVPFDGEWVSTAAEHFATTGDVYRITEALDPAFDHADTADGQAKTKVASMRRLARMIGCDVERFPEHNWLRLAQWYADLQVDNLCMACQRQLSRQSASTESVLMGLGAGAFLAQRVAQRLNMRYLDFAVSAALPRVAAHDVLAAIDVCGPAFAVARLLHAARA